jgi:hypothetical protein
MTYFGRELAFVRLMRFIDLQRTRALTAPGRHRSEAHRKDMRQLERYFTISRAWEYQKAVSSLSVRGPRMPRTDPTTWIDSTMARFRTFQSGGVSIDGDRNPGICEGCISRNRQLFSSDVALRYRLTARINLSPPSTTISNGLAVRLIEGEQYV